ncbi:MAG: hypothetical protein WCW27_03190 [Patescibacteria group bacterium]|jgi:hypothetical protein
MSRQTRVIIGLICAVIVFGVIGLAGYRYWQNRAAQQAKEAELAAQPTAASLLASPNKKILFLAETRQIPVQRTLYLHDVISLETIPLLENVAQPWSNYLVASNTWYGIEKNQLIQHSLSATGITTNTLATVQHAPNASINIAANSETNTIAWVSGTAKQQHIISYNINTATETDLFGNETSESFFNLSWSPDGQNLAFTNSLNQLIIVTAQGAQLENPTKLDYTTFNSVHWLDNNTLSTVLTSTKDNPKPFVPKLVLINKTGTILEEHTVFNNIGVPIVLWDNTATNFMFYNPWISQFVTYTRFNELISSVPSNNINNVIPFGWIPGTDQIYQANTIANYLYGNTNITNNLNNNANVAPNKPFNVTAEQWDYYNQAVRTILNQFAVDFSTYRFAVNDTGIAISIAAKPEETKPEKILVQTTLQALAVLPDVPAVSFQLTNNNEPILSVNNLTKTSAEQIALDFTKQPLNNLFIITPEQPYGVVAPKTNNPTQNYLGDLLYANTGEYNPVPVLAALQATIPQQRYIATTRYALSIPTDWETSDLKTLVGAPYETDDLLLKNAETTFVSNSVWTGFSVTIRQYSLPKDIGLNEWLQVNRRDNETTDIAATSLPEPLTGQQIITNNPNNIEYVLSANSMIFVINLDRTTGVTETDASTAQKIISSFSDLTAFQPE